MSKETKYYGPGLPITETIKEINRLMDAVNEARKDLAAAKLRTKSK